jgi:hypothetical protein
MKLKIFVIRDIKVGEFNYQPIVVPNNVTLDRVIEAAVEDVNSNLGRYPEDFQVFQIGEFDTESGIINAFTAPEHYKDVITYLEGVK